MPAHRAGNFPFWGVLLGRICNPGPESSVTSALCISPHPDSLLGGDLE